MYRIVCTLVVLLFWPAVSRAVDSHLIYLNNCKPNGCLLHSGSDNAVTHTSSIPDTQSTLTAFAYSDETFGRTASCLRGVFARYDVSITTVEPGILPRREMMIAGQPENVGLQSGIRGVSPFSGEPIDNAIAFAFANTIGDDPDLLCWTAAMQLGHLYGLDHAHYCPDLMSYLDQCGVKSFTDFDAPCGEFSDRTCASGAATQNSDATLRLVIGDVDRIFFASFDPEMPTS
jgi:hypothetical protein